MKPPAKASSYDAKNLLREKLKIIRSQVTPVMAEAASQKAWTFLCCLPEFKRAKGIGAFASTPHEINTYPLLEASLESGKNLFLPRLSKDQSHFDFYPISDLKNLSTGPHGIPEPTGAHPADWNELDLVLVPGLGFDLKGNRLGYGKGFYDQVLPRLKKTCLTIGLAFSFQIVDQVPVTPSDFPVRSLLTEKGFQSCES